MQLDGTVDLRSPMDRLLVQRPARDLLRGWNHGKAGACGLVLCPARLFIFRGTHMTGVTFYSSHVSASTCKVIGEAKLAQHIWASKATWQQWSPLNCVQRLARNGHPTKGPQSLTLPQNRTRETCSEWAKSKSFEYAVLPKWHACAELTRAFEMQRNFRVVSICSFCLATMMGFV